VAVDASLAYAAIGELSEPLRATIVAVDIAGLSYKEAARSLRTRTGTIMSRLYRAREQVAVRMEAS
jgi:RNA polymerase sigma-70 factor, ECF subfamily